MRCIEMNSRNMTDMERFRINYNMRCIEMIMQMDTPEMDRDKLQHEMY